MPAAPPRRARQEPERAEPGQAAARPSCLRAAKPGADGQGPLLCPAPTRRQGKVDEERPRRHHPFLLEPEGSMSRKLREICGHSFLDQFGPHPRVIDLGANVGRFATEFLGWFPGAELVLV